MCRLSVDKQFELQKLTQMFYGKTAGSIFCFIVVINMEMVCWSLAQVGAGSWSTNLPLDSDLFVRCTDSDFLHHTHPQGRCWNSYAICVVLFGVVVVPLSCCELGQLKVLTVTMSLFRFIVLGAMAVHSFVLGVDTQYGTGTDDDKAIPWTNFAFTGWVKATPVFIFGLVTSVGIPTLSQPVTNKLAIPKIFALSVATAALVYAVVGVAISIHFKSDVNEMANLNWVPYTYKENSWAIRVMAYCIILFPSLDVILHFVFSVIVVTNNLESWLFIRAEQSRARRTAHRFMMATIPLIGCLFVTNLVTVLQFLSLTINIVAFLTPAALQYRSRKVWIEKLSSLSVSVNRHPTDMVVHVELDESTSLLEREEKTGRRGYDTPYSGWYSKPPVIYFFIVYSCVCIVLTVTGVALATDDN